MSVTETEYRVAIIDPPWNKLMGRARRARVVEMGFNPLTAAVGPPNMADNSALWIWTLENHVSLWVIEALVGWGFNVMGSLVWRKLTPKGNRHFGLGSPLRQEHARVVVGHRGKPEIKLRNQRSVFDAKAPPDGGRPPEFYDIIRSLYDGPYCEVYPVRSVPGFDPIDPSKP